MLIRLIKRGLKAQIQIARLTKITISKD